MNDNPNHRAFRVQFTAYNYFNLVFNYDLGSIGIGILNGNAGISISNSQKWYEGINLNLFFEELKNELELRIPDKYLKQHGWL